MSTKKICTQCGAEYGPEQKFCPNDGSLLRADSSHDPLIGQVVADRYHVTALIGEGGMGRVYVAEHVRMGRKSALKVMSPALAATADAITRFNREAANASRINHPNVAAIYDFGETPEGLLYLAMEFVEGETLHALIHRTGPLPIARAARITKGAADALHAAHHLGIIHRDLKPDNIMLARQLDGADWVKVVDFGIAKAVAAQGQGGGSGGQTVTTAGVSLGTPEYMSPEQLAGEALDHHTDIYSLGLVLFNMLTGELPYPKLTSKETLVRRLTSLPATLAEVRPDVAWPAAVQAVLTRALDPEPKRRYASVDELGRDIVAAAAGLADDDLDRTVRVSALDRQAPALAATAMKRPAAPAGGAGRGGTRPLAAPPPKPASRGIWLAAAAVLVLGGGYTAWNAAHRPTEAHPTPSVAADTTRDTVRRAADSNAAPAPGGAVANAAPQTSVVHADTARPRVVSPRRAPSLAVASQPSRTSATPPQTAPDPNAAAAVGDPSNQDGIRKAVAEIRGHMENAGREIAGGRANAANMEIRQAQAEIRTLRDLMPGDRMPLAVDRQLKQAGRQALTACFNAAAEDMGGQQRCREFEQRMARGARGRGASNRRF